MFLAFWTLFSLVMVLLLSQKSLNNLLKIDHIMLPVLSTNHSNLVLLSVGTASSNIDSKYF